MGSRVKRARNQIHKTNEKYYMGVLISLCQQPFKIRIAYCFDILFKRWKKWKEQPT